MKVGYMTSKGNTKDRTAATQKHDGMFRVTDLRYDRGWSAKMIKWLGEPEKVVKRGSVNSKLWSEATVLKGEKLFQHQPVSRPRPAGKKYVSKKVKDADSASYNAARSLSAYPLDVQRRVVHLQSIMPFYTPLGLERQSIADYNILAASQKRPLIGVNITDPRILHRVKIRFLVREVRKIKKDARHMEILKAIRLVYPYLEHYVDEYVRWLNAPVSPAPETKPAGEVKAARETKPAREPRPFPRKSASRS